MNPKDYMLATEVARLAGIDVGTVARMAARNKIRIFQIPGSTARYHRGDVEALLARAYRVAGEPEPAAIDQAASV